MIVDAHRGRIVAWGCIFLKEAGASHILFLDFVRQ